MPSMNERGGYWRSLGELAGTPAFRLKLEREFADGAVDAPGAFTRRRFLQIMGASAALAGFSGCRWPREKIVPYAHRPEGWVPGEALRFATSGELRGCARGLLATSVDGRPIKIDGNENDPIGRGASSAIDQASVLDLYDPDRTRTPIWREGRSERSVVWGDFLAWTEDLVRDLRATRGARLAFLSEPTGSECVARLRRRLAAELPEALWFEYDPLSMDHAREGLRIAFGKPLRAHLDLASAAIVFSLDADLLDDDPAALLHARELAAARRIEEGRTNRLYVVESVPCTTGAKADHRLSLPPRAIAPFALAVLHEGVFAHELEAPDRLREILRAREASDPPARAFAKALAEDLAANRGRSAIAAGYRQPPAAHAAAHLMNDLLGNIGRTVAYTADPDPERPNHFDAIRSLAKELEAGRVETLVVLGGNPAYDAPADLGFADLLARVPHAVHLSSHRNETSLLAEWQIPRAHFLESWDLSRAHDGTLLARQPLIEPLYGGRTDAELLAVFLDGRAAASGHDLAREAFGAFVSGEADFEKSWRRLLHDGVLGGSARPKVDVSFQAGPTADSLEQISHIKDHAGENGLEAVFLRDASVHDGRFANNAWLQETPDPMTKLTWDNAALVGPSTARALGVETEDVVRLSINGRAIEIAAYVLPGVAAGTIALPLGYGRTRAGRVGNGDGFDVYPLRASGAPYFAFGAAIERTGRRYPLAATEEHHLIDPRATRERERRVGSLVREVEADEYLRNPAKAMHAEEVHHPPLVSLFPPHSYDGHRWGMAIDLDACTGCNACVVACQAENNIPVVGKKQVRNQREMHWIRIDRSFRGDPDSPEIVHQPVACVHCENAPCEQVCPVAATVHTSEGLNAMVYNRCIGTRYCSNNCPYKVRRFNFFNYRKNLEPVEKMAMNPEVTVRSRGVMEKCTFCVQRIEAARIVAKNENRPLRDGEIVPACAASCPARAIVFGDLNDPESRVAKLHGEARAYGMLAELNVRPRTAYLARVRNRNERLAKREKEGHEPIHG